ncbi:hypothetical protein BC829DRAFT_424183 [Chytridium lagenaria]|nr:hypothetical protein BC829DRAFT_424183 [Chytridium lagenaria]
MYGFSFYPLLLVTLTKSLGFVMREGLTNKDREVVPSQKPVPSPVQVQVQVFSHTPAPTSGTKVLGHTAYVPWRWVIGCRKALISKPPFGSRPTFYVPLEGTSPIETPTIPSDTWNSPSRILMIATFVSPHLSLMPSNSTPPSNNVLLVMSFSRLSVATLMITDVVIIVLKVLHFAMIVVLPSIPPTLLDQRPFLVALESSPAGTSTSDDRPVALVDDRRPCRLCRGLHPIEQCPRLSEAGTFLELFDKGHLQLPSPKPLP